MGMTGKPCLARTSVGACTSGRMGRESSSTIALVKAWMVRGLAMAR
jgi:hypothetical protein